MQVPSCPSHQNCPEQGKCSCPALPAVPRTEAPLFVYLEQYLHHLWSERRSITAFTEMQEPEWDLCLMSTDSTECQRCCAPSGFSEFLKHFLSLDDPGGQVGSSVLSLSCWLSKQVTLCASFALHNFDPKQHTRTDVINVCLAC